MFLICISFSPTLRLSAMVSGIVLSIQWLVLSIQYLPYPNAEVGKSPSGSNNEETTLSIFFLRILRLGYPSFDRLLNSLILCFI